MTSETAPWRAPVNVGRRVVRSHHDALVMMIDAVRIDAIGRKSA